MKLKNLKTVPLLEKDKLKIRKDLELIKKITQIAKENGCRVIISGGYASDGSLGSITRPHNDIDIQILGTRPAIPIVLEIVNKLGEFEIEDKGRGDFYYSLFIQSNGIGADVYYIEVKSDPWGEERIVIKKDGSFSEVKKPNIIKVSLDDIEFEAIDPIDSIADRIYKRDFRKDKPNLKYDQDIENLRLITDAKKVEEKLSQIINR